MVQQTRLFLIMKGPHRALAVIPLKIREGWRYRGHAEFMDVGSPVAMRNSLSSSSSKSRGIEPTYSVPVPYICTELQGTLQAGAVGTTGGFAATP